MGDVVGFHDNLNRSSKYQYFYLLGRRDYAQGRPLTPNPYNPAIAAMECTMWRNGWLDEQEEQASSPDEQRPV